VRFQFAWSVEERALAREALWRLPNTLKTSLTQAMLRADRRFERSAADIRLDVVVPGFSIHPTSTITRSWISIGSPGAQVISSTGRFWSSMLKPRSGSDSSLPLP
jgi:hypothetical protein